MGEPMPLSYTEIKAWRDLMQVEVTPLDIQILKQLDILSLNSKKN